MKLLKEDPDSITYNFKTYKWDNTKTLVFGYNGNDFYCEYSPKFNVPLNHAKIIFDTNRLRYSGRIFIIPKIITFWENPPKHFLQKFIKDVFEKAKIKIDDKWKIQVYDGEPELSLDSGTIGEFQKPSEYMGKKNNFKKTFHLQSPIYKKRKVYGFGSNKYKDLSIKAKFPTVAHFTSSIHSESLSLKKIMNLIL